MFYKAILLVCLVTLSSCAQLGNDNHRVSHYDLGPAPEIVLSSAGVGAVDVVAPSWLDTAALQYRLAYQDGHLRHAYAESRLVAPPEELVAQFLQRRLVTSRPAFPACKIRVRLDEFVHVFDSPATSRAVLEARARLLAAGGVTMAQHSFSLSRPAPTPDAAGGVVAMRGVTEDLAERLAEWIAALDRDQLPGLNDCRSYRAETGQSARPAR